MRSTLALKLSNTLKIDSKSQYTISNQQYLIFGINMEENSKKSSNIKFTKINIIILYKTELSCKILNDWYMKFVHTYLKPVSSDSHQITSSLHIHL